MMLRRTRLVAIACCIAVVGALWMALTVAGTGHRTPAEGAGAAAAPAANRPSLLVIGASYSAALGATSRRHGFAQLVGAELGLRVTVSAVPGTGYLNPGPMGQGTFLERLGRLHRVHQPKIVLIQGGRNDAGYPSAGLGTAVCATVDSARARYTGSHVVLLGDVPFHVPVGLRQMRVADVLADAAHRCHVAFLNPIAEHWITAGDEDEFAGPVPHHPNNLGYAYIAHRVVADLRGLGLVAGSNA